MVAIGALGFWYLEGLTPLEAFYMTVTTITTVGYGDYYPHTTYGQTFTVGLILAGVGVALYVLTGIIGLVLEGQLREAFGITRVKRGVAKMKNHKIICGGGRTGSVIVDEFRDEGVDFVVIENKLERVKELRKRGILVVEGDATTEEALIEAGVERASGLVSTLPLDADNLYLSITAKGINNDLDIVTRGSSEKAAKMLYKTGVKKVVMIEELGGRRLARSLTKPAVVAFIDSATKTGDASLESFTVQKGAKIANKKIKNLRFKERIGASIVAIIRGGKVISNVGPEDEILEGDTVVVIGKKELLEKLEEMDFF
ncbi:MAG TPA: potassium channel protein [Desulfobacteria bacterium]|nr:potassium channel protein [Desulfobacteria bacterium]